MNHKTIVLFSKALFAAFVIPRNAIVEIDEARFDNETAIWKSSVRLETADKPEESTLSP